MIKDANGNPVVFPYYEDAFGFFGEYWNINALDDQGLLDPSTYSYVFKKSVFLYDDIAFLADKINYTDLREKNEFDERQIKIEYTYTFQDVPVVGDVSVSGGFTLLRDNDIYSKLESEDAIDGYTRILASYVYKRLIELQDILNLDYYPTITNFITEMRHWGLESDIFIISRIFQAKGEELFPPSEYPGLISLASEYLGGLASFLDTGLLDWDPDIKEYFENLDKLINEWKTLATYLDQSKDYSIRSNYSVKTREQRREELNLGLSLDNILNSNATILNPNMSVNFETSGHLWMQYGVFFSMSLNKISDKLTWDTSLDSYWFDHDYFKVSECTSYYVVDKNGKIDQNKTLDLLEINSAFNKTKYVAHSTSGFKTLTARTSLNYAIRPNITISPNVSAVHRFDILDKTADNQKYMGDNDFIWYGINLNYAF